MLELQTVSWSSLVRTTCKSLKYYMSIYIYIELRSDGRDFHSRLIYGLDVSKL